jgi:hypothetical protein
MSRRIRNRIQKDREPGAQGVLFDKKKPKVENSSVPFKQKALMSFMVHYSIWNAYSVLNALWKKNVQYSKQFISVETILKACFEYRQ